MSDAAEPIDIKKRARRRLVGAIALALLAAVILPMMMEQEPHPGNADIQISIPARSSPASAAPELPAVVDAAPAEETAPSAPATAETDTVTPSSVAPPAPAVAADRESERSSTAGNGKEKAKPAPAAVDPVEEMRARAAIEGRELPRGETFVLQIGAFADAGKAANMVKELKAKGFPAYAEAAGKVTRVRVGPLVGRKATEKAAAELAELGFSTVRISR